MLLRFILLGVCLGWLTGQEAHAAEAQVLSTNRFHLGVEGFPEWEEFANDKPSGRRLDLSFDSITSTNTHTLFLRQRDVKGGWQVQVNGKKIGNLIPQETALVSHYEVPAGLLKSGSNLLSIVPPAMTDDIEISDIRLAPGSPERVLGAATFDFNITEAPNLGPLPCRITIADASGALAALTKAAKADTNNFIIRPGVIYSRDGHASINLLPGDYTIYASRGMEYSVATQQVSIAHGESKTVNLSIRREVNTKGWVATDTHIHTLTHSGHGDATEDERMFTIAGEGLELAIATDHNHNTDYSPAGIRTKLNQHFTSVIGNEVTTKVGHFNAFPVAAGSTVPDIKTDDWVLLTKNIRAIPGVQVITLNHPRDVHSGFTPYSTTNFTPITGTHAKMTNELFDAMETITSGALQSDIYLLYRDWFALLNRGYRIMSVGSSDTHDVSRFILGQGRTYLAANDDVPGRINIDEACRSLKNGRASVSLGLFADMDVAQKFHLGDLATNLDDEFIVTVHADSPSWSWVQKVELYANGTKIRETEYLKPAMRLRRSSGFVLKRPFHDVYLVGIATGPGITAPFAETPKPYQPSSKTFTPHVLASTNPIWIDGDGDGKYTSPRGYAEQLVKDYGNKPDRLFPALTPYDEAIIIQTLNLCQELGADLKGVEFQNAAKQAAPAVQQALAKLSSTTN